jgi:predicted  nucleic acid-binding Zn-ribbon protein
MAYDDYDDDEPRTAEEMLDSVRKSLSDLDERVKKTTEVVEDGTAGIRLELQQAHRDMLELRNQMARLQNRFDMQLGTLVFANIISGLGVAALVLGAAHAF